MTDPPIEGIAGALVSRLSGRPFVYNLRDMYPDMALGGEIVRPARWVRTLGRAASQGAASRCARDRSGRRHARAHPREGRRSRAHCRRARCRAVSRDAAACRSSRRARNSRRFSVRARSCWQSGLLRSVADAGTRCPMLESEGVGLVFIGEGARKPQIEDAAAVARTSGSCRFVPDRNCPT